MVNENMEIWRSGGSREVKELSNGSNSQVRQGWYRECYD